MKKYNVGVLGCANIAIRSVIPAFVEHPRFVLSAVASRDINKSNSVASQFQCTAYANYDDLVNDENIDLVYIPLPTGLHYEWVLKSLKAKKHVMSEKSLGCCFKEVEEMVHLAESNNLLLIENFQFRFHSQHQWVREYIECGNIGEIRCFRSSFGFPPFPDRNNIRYSKALGGGALLDAGAYTLKALQFILPTEHFIVNGASMLTPQGHDVDIWGGISLISDNGIVAQLAYGFDNSYQCNYEIWGSKAKVTVLRAFTAPKNLSPSVTIEDQTGKREILLSADDHFFNMLTHIADCLDFDAFEDECKQNIIQSRYIQQVIDFNYGR